MTAAHGGRPAGSYPVSNSVYSTSGERRWTLITRLSDLLTSWQGNHQSFVSAVARIVAEEVGDSAMVILTEVPGLDDPVLGYAHVDPETEAVRAEMFVGLGADGQREWVNRFANSNRSGQHTIFGAKDDDTPLLARLRVEADAVRFTETFYAPLQLGDGRLRGVLFCARDSESAPFEGDDRAALATAADIVNVGIDLASERVKAQVFMSLSQSSPDFVGIAQGDGRVIFINEAGRALVGVPSEVDVTQTTMHDYYTPNARPLDLTPDEWPQVKNAVWEGLSSLRDWRDDSEIAVSARTFTVADAASGEPIAVATVQRDMRREIAARRAIAELAEQRRLLLSELVNAQQAEGPKAATAAAIHELVHNAQNSLRRLLLELEPADGPHRHLDDALRQVVDAFFADCTTSVTITGELTELPSEVASVLYRASREAVSNARRHAAAENVAIVLSEDDHFWRISIEDDGIGMPENLPQRPGHLGLRGMHSRVEALAGAVSIGSRGGGGTAVLLEVPRPAG